MEREKDFEIEFNGKEKFPCHAIFDETFDYFIGLCKCGGKVHITKNLLSHCNGCKGQGKAKIHFSGKDLSANHIQGEQVEGKPIETGIQDLPFVESKPSERVKETDQEIVESVEREPGEDREELKDLPDLGIKNVSQFNTGRGPSIGPHFQTDGEEYELFNFDLKEKQTVIARKKGRDLFALCPWHSDTRPSLQIYPETKKWYCHGCKMSGRFYDPEKAARAESFENREIESTFDYHNENGELAFQVVRFKPKDFHVRRKNPDFKEGDGESKQWIYGKGDTKVIPYHLPDIINSSGPVYIAEGERKADALKEMELTATCNPFGAGKWREEFNEYLKGRELVILCDNDKPGLGHGSMVASSNFKTAKSIKMPMLPGLPEKGDIIDFLQNGGTKESLFSDRRGNPALSAVRRSEQTPLPDHFD